MRTERSEEGWLLIENKFAPGPSAEDLAKWGKPEAPVVGVGITYESATYTCSHCHTIVILNPNRSRPRNKCMKCFKRICDNPICNMDCKPLVELFDDLRNQLTKTPDVPITDLTDHPLVTLT
jgi:hypothetical protein